MRTLLVLTVLLAAGLTAVSADGRSQVGSCSGSQLSGRFAVVPGSAGAGNITYRLVLKNVSTRTCTVTGLPLGRLLGRRGQLLPTHVHPAHPGALLAPLVQVSPGQSARATARFSPDVPGVGEGGRSRCEPLAYWFRVSAPGGGTTRAPMRPATSVCEHGSLSFSAYGG